jgi:2-isopropylmalate synthase
MSIEGGRPGSNPRDMAFFKDIKSYDFKRSRWRPSAAPTNPAITPESDGNLKTLIQAETGILTCGASRGTSM